MKYMLVKESLDSGIQISVQRATQLLGVSRCGFYKWLRSKSEQVNAIPDMDIRNTIESGMGFRYHLYPSIGRIRLPGGNPGPFQQEMHRMESG